MATEYAFDQPNWDQEAAPAVASVDPNESVIAGNLLATQRLFEHFGYTSDEDLNRLQADNPLSIVGSLVVAKMVNYDAAELSVGEAESFMARTVDCVREHKALDRRRTMPMVQLDRVWLRMLGLTYTDINGLVPSVPKPSSAVSNTVITLEVSLAPTLRQFLPQDFNSRQRIIPAPSKVLGRPKLSQEQAAGAAAYAAKQAGIASEFSTAIARALHDTPELEGTLAWQKSAVCAQTDPETFFPEKGGSTREAKKTCTSCTVRNECLEYALDNNEKFGIWGGLSERERRRLRRLAF